MNLDKFNIDNLTSLWRKMGVEKNPESFTDGFTISRTWPNRYWFDWSATKNQIIGIHSFLHLLPPNAIVPVWYGAGEAAVQLENYLNDECFHVQFQQLAMYLELPALRFEYPTAEDTIQVQSLSDLEAWTATASAAFGYWIDITAIQQIMDDKDVHLLLVRKDNQPVATALVYKTGEIVGAHLVGVRNNFRGMGIAKTLMQQVIQLSAAIGGKYLTLQASVVGEPLYRSLGFTPQFLIRNYRRN